MVWNLPIILTWLRILAIPLIILLCVMGKRNPLGGVADNPKRYQVSFCSERPDPEIVSKLEAACVEPEALAVLGREIYAWHPDGVARSKLWTALGGKGLGVTATSRNWTTVTTLLEMADE